MKRNILLFSAFLAVSATVLGIIGVFLLEPGLTSAASTVKLNMIAGYLGFGSVGTFFVGTVYPKD